MRSLSPTLEAAQEAMTIDALVKIVLTHGASSYTYDRDRILDRNHPEEPYSQKARVVLDNSDGALTNLALQGFKGVISYGAITSVGEEYSACAPLWVISQQLESSPGKLDCVLSLIGIMNLMAEDKASASYMPEETDTKSVKTLINEILGATLACYSHCQAYQVIWKGGYDTLADTYKPKDSFRIYVGGSRLAAFRRLIDYTGNVARAQADGKVHIFKPTISGEVFDSQYSLESGHTFFSKAYRKRVVIPGYIVVQSQPDDDPQYSGYAKDDGYDDLPAELKKRDYKLMRLESNAQATDIAEAILSKHQLWSEMGAANVPFWNVGAEVFDYVKVGAFCAEDVYRVGNIGHLTRHYNAERAEAPMTFSFGDWMTVRKALAGLEIDADELEAYFSRLTVKDLYVENILAKNVDFVWIDPDNTIDLSKIGDDLDNLPDGEVYARVKLLHLDAGIIKLDENVLYKAGYNPTEKMPGDADLDDIPDGVTYQRARSAALTAAGLVILDQVVVGTYGLVKSTDISAGHILLSKTEGDLDDIANGVYGKVLSTDITAGHIKMSAVQDYGGYGKVLSTDISAGHIKLKVNQDLGAQGIEIVSSSGGTRIKITSAEIAGYLAGSKQFYLSAYDGKAYCGAGAIVLDAGGIKIYGEVLHFYYPSTLRGYIAGDYGVLTVHASQDLFLSAGGSIISGRDLSPGSHETYMCGFSTKAWWQVVAKYLYSDDGTVSSYQEHDDIALLKRIKSRKDEKGRDVLDGKTLPKELTMKGKGKQTFVNIPGLVGLNLGIMKELVVRIEALEAKAS